MAVQPFSGDIGLGLVARTLLLAAPEADAILGCLPFRISLALPFPGTVEIQNVGHEIRGIREGGIVRHHRTFAKPARLSSPRVDKPPGFAYRQHRSCFKKSCYPFDHRPRLRVLDPRCVP
jgi:hypothetical protein